MSLHYHQAAAPQPPHANQARLCPVCLRHMRQGNWNRHFNHDKVNVISQNLIALVFLYLIKNKTLCQLPDKFNFRKKDQIGKFSLKIG